MVGHSILYGIQADVTSRPPYILSYTAHRAAPEHLAVAGSAVSDCTSRFNTYVNGTGVYTAVVWQCGVNDLLGGTSAAAVEASSQIVWDTTRAQGMQLIINYETPCAGWSTCDAAAQTRVTSYNALAATYCSAHAGVTCIDLYTQLGSGAALAGAYDSGDHLHPNNAGSVIIGTLDAAALTP